MKDLFLAGQSLIQIQDYLNSKCIPSPRGNRWNYLTVRYILRNPYYAGEIVWGTMKTYFRRRKGTRVASKNDPTAIVEKNGLHSQLWDKTTHQAILAEFKKRGRFFTGKKTSQLSSLIKCSVCGSPLWANSSGPRGKKIKYWRCRQAFEANRKHIYVTLPCH
jgi:site-specific DNA recombinase